MDLREEEKEMRMQGSSSYGHLVGESSGGVPRMATAATHNGNNLNHNFQQQEPLGSEMAKFGGRSKQKVRYRECLKNHAANIGGNIYDGCGEFMPSGEEGTLEALKCAACDCHRNFHRKEVDGDPQFSQSSRRTTPATMLSYLQLPPPLPSPGLHHQKFSMGLNLHSSPTATIVPPMNVAFAGCGTESSSEDLNAFQSTVEAVPPSSFGVSKKRFRTKFTQEQKERMFDFAEKVGWRFQKQDEEEIERFCAEVGVKRQVLKVWMHNNKNTVKKQHENQDLPPSLDVITGSAGDQGGIIES